MSEAQSDSSKQFKICQRIVLYAGNRYSLMHCGRGFCTEMDIIAGSDMQKIDSIHRRIQKSSMRWFLSKKE